MRLSSIILTMAFSVLRVLSCFSQDLPDNISYISDNKIHFIIHRNWSVQQKQEVSRLFEIDSLLIEKVLADSGKIMYDSIEWESKHINRQFIELSRPLDDINNLENHNDVILLDDIYLKELSPGNVFNESPQYFGVNKLHKKSRFNYSDSIAEFFLEGFENSGQVFLSGTFNNWSTGKTMMHKSKGGWSISFELKPGRYLYKFIVDGVWIPDPTNKQKEHDGHGGHNSIVYCTNHEFVLSNFSKAKRVFLAGSFNSWRPNDIKIPKSGNSWKLPVFLPEGTHLYKFVVDNQWITDPSNPDIKTDAYGNQNSVIAIGDTVIFSLPGFIDAKSVVLAGSFNNWSWNELPMYRVIGGWELPYVLGPGTYEYKFIVDGRWFTDPENPNITGTGEFVNSVFSFKPNHTFKLMNFPNASKVIVTGSFNNWNQKSYRMTKVNGVWEFPINLKPGKYTYKFIVDDSWMLDPANPNWEDNEYGTGDSVLWIEP